MDLTGARRHSARWKSRFFKNSSQLPSSSFCLFTQLESFLTLHLSFVILSLLSYSFSFCQLSPHFCLKERQYHLCPLFDNLSLLQWITNRHIYCNATVCSGDGCPWARSAYSSIISSEHARVFVCLGEAWERINTCSLTQQCQSCSADPAEEQCEYNKHTQIFTFIPILMCATVTCIWIHWSQWWDVIKNTYSPTLSTLLC